MGLVDDQETLNSNLSNSMANTSEQSGNDLRHVQVILCL